MRFPPAAPFLLSLSVLLVSFSAPSFAVSRAKRPATPALLKTTPAARDYSRLVIEAKRTKAYEATVVVPVLRAKTAVARAANRAVLKWARGDVQDFVHQAREEGAGRTKDVPQYGLDSGPAAVFVTPQLVSVSMDRYNYLGGAHGMTNRFVWRFGLVNGRARELKLADFFTDKAYAKRVNNLVMKKLKANPYADWVHAEPGDTPDVKSLDTAQLNNFSVEKDGLRWTFDPYEMGSYAAGPIEVKLTAAELGPVFRKSWLQR